MSGKQWADEFNRRAPGTMTGTLGTHFVEVSAERAVAELGFKAGISQMTGLFHAGAIISLADEACTAFAAAHAMGNGGWDQARFPLTIQLSANLLANTNRGRIIAEAIPIHRGRTTIVVKSTVRDDDGRLLAHVVATHVIPGGAK